MNSLFCCNSAGPYKAKYLDHDAKFRRFMTWVRSLDADTTATGNIEDGKSPPYAMQLVRQVNYGPLESKRYFVPTDGQDGPFVEITEDDLIQANFQKLNSFKNFKCDSHNKFFELNLYQKDPVNKHHWRANIGRPAGSIDL